MAPKKKYSVFVVLGTRPEAIKLAPLIHCLKAVPFLDVVVCVTAQHRHMLDQMLDVFRLGPDLDLDVMQPGQSPLGVIQRITAGLDAATEKRRPDLLIVQGDTTTTLAAALVAFHKKIPVAHVEAGLRSFNKHNPFPEEGNRVLVDQISDLLFAPTRRTRENLLREGIPADKIFVTGNTAVDAINWACAQPGAQGCPVGIPDLNGDPYVLVTMHRRESFGKPVENVFHALQAIVGRFQSIHVCYPVHPNPNVHDRAHRILRHPRIHLLPPASYVEFVRLMGNSQFIMTDSGGILEEAASLRKPVIVLREVTERPELVEAGGACLAGTDSNVIIAQAAHLLEDRRRLRRMAAVPNPYGDGKASDRIARIIRRQLGDPCPLRSEFENS